MAKTTSPDNPAATELGLQATLRQQATDEWRATFDAICSPLALLDSSHRVQRCNNAYAILVDQGFTAIVGTPCWSNLCKTEGGPPDCPLRRMGETGQPQQARRELGGRSYIEKIDPVRDVTGAIVGAVQLLVDHTEQGQAAKLLMEREAMFAATFEQVAVGITHVALDGRYLRAGCSPSPAGRPRRSRAST